MFVSAKNSLYIFAISLTIFQIAFCENESDKVNDKLSLDSSSSEKSTSSSNWSIVPTLESMNIPDFWRLSKFNKYYEQYRQTATTTTTMAPSTGKKKKDDLMSKILPMLVMPFLISSSMIPAALTSLKFMLLKALAVGKIAILLMVLNALWKNNNQGGVYSHNIEYSGGPQYQKEAQGHYGYNGDEEYGAYVNRRAVGSKRVYHR